MKAATCPFVAWWRVWQALEGGLSGGEGGDQLVVVPLDQFFVIILWLQLISECCQSLWAVLRK